MLVERGVGGLARKYVGVDLAATARRPTGYAVAVNNELVSYGIVYSDEEIIAVTEMASIVAIDAPLTAPKPNSPWRDVDLVLVRRGYRLLPLNTPGMAKLVERALKLRKALEEKGIAVIETHPRSAWLSSGCREPLDAACRVLRCPSIRQRLSKDVVDAIIALSVAYCYDHNCVMEYRGTDGAIYLLKPICRQQSSLYP